MKGRYHAPSCGEVKGLREFDFFLWEVLNNGIILPFIPNMSPQERYEQIKRVFKRARHITHPAPARHDVSFHTTDKAAATWMGGAYERST